MRKPIKRKKKTNEVGQAQMAGPSGPQYDTTGNQRLESACIDVGDWADVITEHVSKLITKNLVEAEVKQDLWVRYTSTPSHGIYDIFVSSKPASPKLNLGKDVAQGEYAATAKHRRADATIRAGGKTPDEAVKTLIDKIDSFIESLPRSGNGPTVIDFNKSFAQEIMSFDPESDSPGVATHWAKIIPGPKLVIAGDELTDILNDFHKNQSQRRVLRSKTDGFARITNRHQKTTAGTYYYPSFGATPEESKLLIANGRYELGNSSKDSDGNTVYNLEFVNVVQNKEDRYKMGPGFTVGTLRDQRLPVAENNELDAIKALAGIGKTSEINNGSNVSLTAQEKSKLMKENNIKPGTPEWFKLWFSRPYMTGEKPIGN